MPTYEYECQRCGLHFERFQNMSEEPLKRCPECRGKVKRVLSGGAGFLFKGSGFHTTDYRSAEYKKRAKEESGGGTPKESKGEKKDGTSASPAR
jgi:putative FmdB family regulatory protein